MRTLVFDIDNTLTPPRRPLPPPMAEALCALTLPFHLAAGSDLDLVRPQLLDPLHSAGFRGSFDAFVSNGSHHVRCHMGENVEWETVFQLRLRDHLGASSFAELCALLESILDLPEFALPSSSLRVEGPRLCERGGMINLAPIGRPLSMTAAAYELRDAFVAFDTTTGYRQRLLARLAQATEPWQRSHGLRVSLGGQTSFDLVIDGYDKRYSLRTLLAAGHEPLTYIGDAFYPGGNDVPILDLTESWPDGSCPIEVIRVSCWEDTLEWLQAHLR